MLNKLYINETNDQRATLTGKTLYRIRFCYYGRVRRYSRLVCSQDWCSVWRL